MTLMLEQLWPTWTVWNNSMYAALAGCLTPAGELSVLRPAWRLGGYGRGCGQGKKRQD